MGKLRDKVAVVTGGNSGIGLAIARRFVAEGARVAVLGRHPGTLTTAAEEFGAEGLVVQGDVSEVSSIDRFYAEVADRFGRIDAVVANAGVLTLQNFADVDEAAFDRQIDTNLKGTFFTAQRGLALMNDGGAILFLSSVAGSRGFAGMSAYSAAKAGVRSLARTLTAELAPRGIRVNVLSPGPIDTPIFSRLGIPAAQIPDARKSFAGMVPAGRLGKPEEVASAAAFLVSPEASFITGVELAADGGMAQV